MQEAIYLATKDQVSKAQAVIFETEKDLETLLIDHPVLLGGDLMSDDARRWLLVANQAAIPDGEAENRWALDILFVDQDSTPTLVEVKRKTDTRLRREVVGQMLDYAANASAYWPGDMMRRQFEATCRARGGDPVDVLKGFLGKTDPDTFWAAAESKLREGDVRLLFVADRIPKELLRIVSFLNERMQPTEVLAVEVQGHEANGIAAHIVRVMGSSVVGTSRSKRRRWTEQEARADFQKRVAPEYLGAVDAVISFAKNEAHLNSWGSGADRASVGPSFPELSKRSPITIYSDGVLQLKLDPGWFDDTPMAPVFRATFERMLVEAGWISERTEDGDVTMPIAAWAPRVTELLALLRAARAECASGIGKNPK